MIQLAAIFDPSFAIEIAGKWEMKLMPTTRSIMSQAKPSNHHITEKSVGAFCNCQLLCQHELRL